jgi:UDP-N-acetyl-D-galactosamine dehydrogenase
MGQMNLEKRQQIVTVSNESDNSWEFKGMTNELMEKKTKLAVIGLGYVGMPLAIAFAKKVQVIGFDINKEKIERYQKYIDPTGEVGEDEMRQTTMIFTDDKTRLKEAKFLIVTVPTPVHSDKTPDLNPMIQACEIIGRSLTRGTVVIFESTVYPGVTEEICIPVLEKESGLIGGKEFKVGYSPERVNPGDKVNRLNTIKKIVSGMDEITLETVAKVYELIIDAGVYKAPSIKVAEAAKLAENAQRDINIAFMNELAMVFDRMHIQTKDVIEAMNTKWNALGFYPGLVGGHCIGIDPYYFIYQAERLGFSSQIIALGRKINDAMGAYIADLAIKQLVKISQAVKDAKVYIMGITFKENCPDVRNSKVEDIIKRLNEYGIFPILVDPIADKEEAKKVFDMRMVSIEEVSEADCMIFAVAHEAFKNLSGEALDKMFKILPPKEKIIIDVKNIFDKQQLEDKGYLYQSL